MSVSIMVLWHGRGGGQDTFCFAMSTIDTQGVGCEDVRCCPAITPPQARCTPHLVLHGAPWCSMRQCCHPTLFAPQPLASRAGGVLMENEFRKAPRRHALGSMALVVCVCMAKQPSGLRVHGLSLHAVSNLDVRSCEPPLDPSVGGVKLVRQVFPPRRRGARNSGLLRSQDGQTSGCLLICPAQLCPASPAHRHHPAEPANAPTRRVEPRRHRQRRAQRVRGRRLQLKILLARSMPVGVSGKVLRSSPESIASLAVAILSTENSVRANTRLKLRVGFPCWHPRNGRQNPPTTLASRHVATSATLAAISRDLGPLRCTAPSGRWALSPGPVPVDRISQSRWGGGGQGRRRQNASGMVRNQYPHTYCVKSHRRGDQHWVFGMA